MNGFIARARRRDAVRPCANKRGRVNKGRHYENHEKFAARAGRGING